ncbi:MAG TPA: hypothetical protein EYH29_02680, partial [Caldilineales bacterium]|nr:hypothetical protein [Caldilineales bacterium]
DFTPISFYKMFGYPTGVGALIARREALRKLVRPWFGGGAVRASLGMVTSFEDIARFLTFLGSYLDRAAPPSPHSGPRS